MVVGVKVYDGVKVFRGTLGTQDQDSILRLGNLGWESPEIKKKT